MKKLFLLSFLMLAALFTYAQCPGPAQRTNLINLQKSQSAEGTLAGQLPVTDDCGNLRYAQYVEIENTPVGFIPTATGNTSNLSEFVIASDSTRWYIDWQGRGYIIDNSATSDKNGYYGGNGGNGGDATIPSVTESTLTNQLTFYRATDDAGGLVPIRIEVAAGNEPDFMSFKNLTDSLVIKRSDQDFEMKCTNGLSIFGNTSNNPANAGISLFTNGDLIGTATDIIDFTAAGNLAINSTTGAASINAADDVFISSGLSIAATATNGMTLITTAGAPLTISSLASEQAVYSADYCDVSDDLGVPNIGCVKALISDSISGLVSPPGLINQTLRYSANDVLEANSQIYNNGSQVSIGTTIFDSRYEVNVLGDLRVNNQAFFGNAVNRSFSGAVLGTNDSTATTASHVYFSNRSNTTGAHMDVTIHSSNTNSDSRLHWISSAGESQANAGWDAADNTFKFSMDPSATLETQMVYTILSSGEIGIGITDPSGQMEFAASVDDGTNGYPIILRNGDLLDTKVDGGITYISNPVTSSADVTITAGTTDFYLGKCLMGSASIDFAALGVLGTESQPCTVSGAAVGDRCLVSEPAAAAGDGVIYTCRISAVNTARITVLNATTAGFNPGGGTFIVQAFR